MNLYAKLLADRELYTQKAQNIDTAIKVLQKVCNHKGFAGEDTLTEIGRDSHYRHFRCSLCGYYEKR